MQLAQQVRLHANKDEIGDRLKKKKVIAFHQTQP